MSQQEFKLDFFSFADKLIKSDLIEKTTNSDIEKGILNQYLVTSINEAYLSLQIISDTLCKAKRILEVGSGLGITCGYLKSKGFNITSLDPTGEGFNQFSKLANKTREFLNISQQHLAISAEDLKSEKYGKFDLIFSNNVLEHVIDIRQSITNLHLSLSDHGIMIHNCPNYSVPYEPHFGIPLIPFYPKLTNVLLQKSIKDSSLWRSLNYVTAKQIIQLADNLGAELTFEKGTILNALQRLRSDQAFRGRHPFIYYFSSLSKYWIVQYVLNSIPPTFSTPMIFKWRRKTQ